MAYEFFVSYARANNDIYLKKFVKKVVEEVADRRGRVRSDDVRFFDQTEIDLGEDWAHGIVEGLQTSPVLLALFSPAFFKSEYCGKELAVFRERCAAVGGVLPPLIKPVVWIPFKPEEVPEPLRAGQYTLRDPQAVHNVKGFKHLLQQLQTYRTQYIDAVTRLADQIVSAADAHPLPRLPQVPPLAKVQSLFVSSAAKEPPAGQAQPAAAAVLPPSGPKHVHFVYVAASPAAFGKARTSEPYADSGGPDWKPYFPTDKTRVHRFVQRVVASDDLDLTSDELPFDADRLLAEIDQAWERRQIVVLIVDPWSLHWSPRFRDALQRLDGRLDYNWCVLVPWNEADADSVKVRGEIEQELNRTFARHARLSPNPMFYRSGIRSADELKTALHEVLTRLREEIVRAADVNMPIPVGPCKPTITGPSRQE